MSRVQAGLFEVGPGKAYDTIDEALAAVGTGNTHTIRIYKPTAGGTYWLWSGYTGVNGLEDENIVISGKTNLIIEGAVYGDNSQVIIDGDAANTTTPGGFHINDDCTNITIRNLKFVDCYLGGVWAEYGGSGHKLENLTATGNQVYGLYIQTSNTTLENCKVSETDNSRGGGYGIAVRRESPSFPVTNVDITGCHAFDNESDGVSIRDFAENVEVTNCYCYSNDRAGLNTWNSVQDIVIDGGEYYLNDSTGIQIEDCTGSSCIRNVDVYNNCESSTLCNEAGIWIDDAAGIVIEDCDVYGNQLGIRLKDSGNVIVRFNRIHANTKYECGDARTGGMMFQTSNDISVYHNTFWGNGGSNNEVVTTNWEKRFGGFGEDVTVTTGSSNVSFLNNVLGLQTQHQNDLTHMMRWDGTGTMGDVHHNIYYSPPQGDAYFINGSKHSFSSYKNVSGVNETSSQETSSAPVNGTTFAVIFSGDAHNAASGLTDVSNGSGTSVTLGNASHFVVGDVIKTSTGVTATINTINYSTDQVTLSASVSLDNTIYLNRTGNSGAHIGWDQD